MFKSISFAAIIALSSTSVFAMDIANQPQSTNVEVAQADTNVTNVTQAETTTVAAPGNDVIELPQSLKDQFQAVCDSRAIKSKKLSAACEAHAYPKTNKKNTKFTQAGIGKEVLILSANINLLK